MPIGYNAIDDITITIGDLQPVGVPEPNGLGLFGAGLALLGLGVAVRRKRQAAAA